MNRTEKRRILRFLGDLIASEPFPERGEPLRLQLIHMPTATLARYGIQEELADRILDGDIEAVMAEMASELEASGVHSGNKEVTAYEGEGRPVLQFFGDLSFEGSDAGLRGAALRTALANDYAGSLLNLGLGDEPEAILALDDPAAIIAKVGGPDSLPGAQYAPTLRIMTPWPGAGFLLTRAVTQSHAAGEHRIAIFASGLHDTPDRYVIQFKHLKETPIDATVTDIDTDPELEQILYCTVEGLDAAKTYCIVGGDKHSKEYSSIFHRP